MHSPAPFSCFPSALQTEMREIGRNWARDRGKNRDRTLELLEPYLRAAPRDGVAVVRDQGYGPHPRQVLDIYRPQNARRAPFLVFVHGGAFVRGNREISEFVYGNVPLWFARQGYVGVNLEYRLAPEAAYPAATHDLAQGIAWLRDHAERFGGDPDRIFLMGHSAGGAHVASYAYDPHPGYLGRHVKAVALVSARLRADALPENPNADAVRAYYGNDVTRYDAVSPVTHGVISDVPTFIAIAEFENPLLDVYGAELFYRRALHRRRADRFLRLETHNHISIMAHFNTEEEILGRAILDFFR